MDLVEQQDTPALTLLDSPSCLGDDLANTRDAECCGVSELPVIISLENNCSMAYQEGMARILAEELGDVLMTPAEMRQG